MNLFPQKPPGAAPTVSTAPGAPQLGFWQRNRKGLLLFGGCAILLLISRMYASRSREEKKEAKAAKVVATVTHDESDKGDQIAALQTAIAAQRQEQETKAQQELASAMAASQLTAEQKQALVSGSAAVDTSATAAGSQGRAAYYNSANTPTTPDKPTTLVISYREQQAEIAAAPPSTAVPAPSAPTPTPVAEAEGHSSHSEDREHQLAAFTGEKYRIREGTWIPCTEMLRINGSFASDINCLVSIPIYSTSGSRLLIPQGTLALGHVTAVGSQNQQRLFVVFDRFLMPDGYTVTYENAAGLDQVGQTGLRDQVNHHYVQMLGASLALAAIGGLAQIGNYGNANITAASQYRSGLTQGMSESSMQILNRFSTVLPTFTIREGARNNIHLPFNLWLPDYSKHTMKGEL